MTLPHGLFGQATAKADAWVEDVLAETGWDDPQRAFSTLRAVLVVLRDRLTATEAVDLSAHLPVLLRGYYFEGWRPDRPPAHYRHREDFTDRVQAHYARNQGPEAATGIAAVFRVLEKHLPRGEIDHIRHQLPADVRELWPQGPRFG